MVCVLRDGLWQGWGGYFGRFWLVHAQKSDGSQNICYSSSEWVARTIDCASIISTSIFRGRKLRCCDSRNRDDNFTEKYIRLTPTWVRHWIWYLIFTVAQKTIVLTNYLNSRDNNNKISSTGTMGCFFLFCGYPLDLKFLPSSFAVERSSGLWRNFLRHLCGDFFPANRRTRFARLCQRNKKFVFLCSPCNSLGCFNFLPKIATLCVSSVSH